ncbi:MAG: tetratricopeptide repeat protein, partial [Thermoplasmata archaeon]|nr:tetratricopeptide repeat protein [Thermoplasmata archaeon]
GAGACMVLISMGFLLYERAIRTSIESDIVRGDVHYLHRNYTGALVSYDSALQKTRSRQSAVTVGPPINYDVPWYSKGSALILMGELEEGIKCLDMALAINPNNEVTWVNKGNAHSRLGDQVTAMQCYERALGCNTSYEIAWNNLGNIHARQRDYVEALKCYNRALKLNHRYDDAWINKGYVLAKMGKQSQAMKCLGNISPQLHGQISGT